MAFIYFSEKDTNKSIAINTKNVIFVQPISGGSTLTLVTGGNIFVSDEYLDTVARLNNP